MLPSQMGMQMAEALTVARLRMGMLRMDMLRMGMLRMDTAMGMMRPAAKALLKNWLQLARAMAARYPPPNCHPPLC